MSAYSNKISILYVEDEDDVRDGYARALQRVSSTLYIARNGKEGFEMYKKHQPDIIISDIKMPIMNGIEMVKMIKEINPDINIVFTSAHSESAYLLEAIELHVEGYLLKPVEKKPLIQLIQKLSKNILLQKENEMQREIVQHIMDSENSISIVTDGKDISYASKSFLALFKIENIRDFNKPKLFTYIHSKNEKDRVFTLDKKTFFTSLSSISKENFLLSLTDITKMEAKRVITTQKAYVDNLTKAYNRNKFEEVFEYQIKQAKRYKQTLSLTILDIDHFKLFNDAYGHLVGDEILILLVKTVQSEIRESDLFARWGGEEFVILYNNTNLESAYKLSEKFRQKIETIEHRTQEAITASFGVTQYKDGDTIKSMLERADEALYNAKSAGRNQVQSIQ